MTSRLITITEYCTIHQLDPVFIENLEADGIIAFTVIDNQAYLQPEQLPDLETYTRWYFDLGLNTAGIDVVNHLLQKIRLMQDEINLLKNKLSTYAFLNNP
jgi:MerR family transcriptional regulator/heat shock protein HspR